MTYGRDIGRKFYEDGNVRRYPGNTIVGCVAPGSLGFEVMDNLRQMVVDAGMDSHLILMPGSSYHMTVLVGVNDQGRCAPQWPEKLPKDASMDEADDFVSSAVASAKLPGTMRMRFTKMRLDHGGLIAMAVPEDDAQLAQLDAFRNQVAETMGRYMPDHDHYVYHVTLAYNRVLAEGEDEKRMQEMLQKMDAYLAQQPVFTVEPPYMAYYDNMFHFSHTRIPRDK